MYEYEVKMINKYPMFSSCAIVLFQSSLQELIPGVQVHTTPALEAVMDLGGDDHEEEEEPLGKQKGQEDSEAKEDEGEEETQVVKEEPRKKKGRIVKVEEVKTVLLNRNTSITEQVNEDEVAESEEGEAVCERCYFEWLSMTLSILAFVHILLLLYSTVVSHCYASVHEFCFLFCCEVQFIT